MMKISLIDKVTGAHISFMKCKSLNDVVWFAKQYQDLIRDGAQIRIYSTPDYYEFVCDVDIGVVIASKSWPALRYKPENN